MLLQEGRITSGPIQHMNAMLTESKKHTGWEQVRKLVEAHAEKESTFEMHYEKNIALERIVHHLIDGRDFTIKLWNDIRLILLCAGRILDDPKHKSIISVPEFEVYLPYSYTALEQTLDAAESNESAARITSLAWRICGSNPPLIQPGWSVEETCSALLLESVKNREITSQSWVDLYLYMLSIRIFMLYPQLTVVQIQSALIQLDLMSRLPGVDLKKYSKKMKTISAMPRTKMRAEINGIVEMFKPSEQSLVRFPFGMTSNLGYSVKPWISIKPDSDKN